MFFSPTPSALSFILNLKTRGEVHRNFAPETFLHKKKACLRFSTTCPKTEACKDPNQNGINFSLIGRESKSEIGPEIQNPKFKYQNFHLAPVPPIFGFSLEGWE